ncbi:MAG TPA: hypothetical protein VFA23_11180 [Dongiaceae bacterium]|nr:hypothetical protein [Dongiaceae bacterium]
MDLPHWIAGFPAWLPVAQQWNLLAGVVCLAILAFVVARMVRRARDEREAARAVASDGLRIMARRYHETSWS